MARDHFNQQSLGIQLSRSVKEARILMVGAGGIGCELLKNLVLSGFGEIHIVDLDTIDLSNLNRQFLFRQEHIKKSKALVAKDAAHKFNPNVKLEAHHANIKDSQFNVEFFRGFTIVFNALDNLDARRHVNKMCLAADVPLIESGTTGFNGQVQVIKRGVTACYDCTPKETPKSYPVCTIRSTPSQPIHCIVWAKSYLLSEIFGASEDDSVEMDHSQDSENAAEIEKLRKEAQALENIRETMGSASFPQQLFDKVYKADIERLRSMEDMWKSRRKPEPLEYTSALAEIDANSQVSKEKIIQIDQRPWTFAENTVVFKDSLERLSKRLEEMQAASDRVNATPIITFDKDDEDTLDFVTASANLRSMVFGIETKSRFDTKQMAGNIIPAIATTNAIVAGLCVLQSLKVLRGDFSSVKEVFLSPFASERLLSSDRKRDPNPDCPVCSVVQAGVAVDMAQATLNDFVEDFLRLGLNYGEEFTVSNEIGVLYDVEETQNLEKKLSDLGINGHSFLTVIDEDEENPRVNLVINIQETSATMGEKPIKALHVPTDGEKILLDIPRRLKIVSGADTARNGSSDAHTNGTTYIGGTERVGKRRASTSILGLGNDSPIPKRPKISQNGRPGLGDDIIVIEEDGSILID